MDLAANDIIIYSSCPPIVEYDRDSYTRELMKIVRWSDDAELRGGLVYTDCNSIDSWMVAQAAIVNSPRFIPLVAIQPMDLTPFALAKAVASLALLYGRRIDLNFVSGGFSGDLAAQGDDVPHDSRYERLIEYVTIVRTLLAGDRAEYAGRYYNVRGAQLRFPPPADLVPMAYVSGSSEASVQAAESLGLRQLSYPLPPDDFAGGQVRKNKFGTGIRIGIIARDDSSEAWKIAHKRFPVNAQGAARMKLLCAITESSWQDAIISLDLPDNNNGNPYWLVPFRNFHSFCPYLVGSYDEVVEELRKYLRGGVRAFILDDPREQEDLRYAQTAIQRAADAENGTGTVKGTASPQPDHDWYAPSADKPDRNPRLPM